MMGTRSEYNISERIKNTGSVIYLESTTVKHGWRQLMLVISSSRITNIVIRRFDSTCERITKWTSSIINLTVSWPTIWTSVKGKLTCLTWHQHRHRQFPLQLHRLCHDRVWHQLTPIRRIFRCARRDRHHIHHPLHQRLQNVPQMLKIFD